MTDTPSLRKLIIQIPCFNEEESLPRTLAALPRQVAGFQGVEWLVVDDGSEDRTAEVARRHGVDHVVRLPQHAGLARAFNAGLAACLELGADAIVNTDADNQYDAGDIPALVAPILDGRADLVVGCRPIAEIAHYTATKRLLQRVGSGVVRLASRTDIPDAPSGFRAFSRAAAKRIIVFDRYTYTLETIIQAGQSNMAITWVPVGVNPDVRPSRLIKSTWSYVWHSVATIVRFFLHYRAFRFLFTVGVVIALPGVLLGARYVYFVAIGEGGGHVQSLILASLLMSSGFLTIVSGLLADLINANRQLIEDVRARTVELEYQSARRAAARPDPEA